MRLSEDEAVVVPNEQQQQQQLSTTLPDDIFHPPTASRSGHELALDRSCRSSLSPSPPPPPSHGVSNTPIPLLSRPVTSPATSREGDPANEAAYAELNEGGQDSGADGQYHQRLPVRGRQGRCRDDPSDSFPTYGSPKDGVHTLDPMVSEKVARLRSTLAGDFVRKATIDATADSRNKRSTQTQPTRASKRPKTTPENNAQPTSEFTRSRFAVPDSSTLVSGLAPPSQSSVVDLTHSQASGDVELLSNRSTHESVSGNVLEFRDVEKRANGVGSSDRRPRRRKLISQPRTSPKVDTEQDDLAEDNQTLSRQPSGQTKSVKRTAFANPPKQPLEGISDDELLEIEHQSAKKRQHAAGDAVLDAEKTPTHSLNSRPSRADMTRIDFSPPRKKRKADVLSLGLKRAVSGRDTFDADRNLDDQICLKALQENQLIAVDRKGNTRGEYLWLGVKLNTCKTIRYTTAGTHAEIRRSLGQGIGSLMVLEFQEPGEAHEFALWAQKRLHTLSMLSVNVESADSEKLQKIFDTQWNQATNYQPQTSQSNDIELLKHNQERTTINAEQSVPKNDARPSSSQQTTPYRSSHALRNGMDPGGSTSTPAIPYTTSRFFNGKEEKEPSSEPRRTRDLPSRPTRDATARRISEPKPAAPPNRSPSPAPWTALNPEWEGLWDARPLVFPATGKNRTSVYKEDMLRLEEGQFMNDSLIGFYSRYLQVQLELANKELADRVYFMNTYFYQKLTERSGRGINYDGVKTWTAKVDLFSYDYVVVPINEQTHWYLAIICHPSKLLRAEGSEAEASDVRPATETINEGLMSTVGRVESMSLENTKQADDTQKTVADQIKTLPAKSQAPRKPTPIVGRKKDPGGARVITLDSLGVGHSTTCGNLKEYLVRELKDKKNLDVDPPAQFGMTAKNIPEQLDHASCGAFLLGYLREFLKNPDEVVRLLVNKERLDWKISSIDMRTQVRDIIIERRKEQNQRLGPEKKVKRKSNIQPSLTSKSPEDEPVSGPATPKTPKPVCDVLKNPSSTVKGSPVAAAMDRAPLLTNQTINSNVVKASSQVELDKSSDNRADSTKATLELMDPLPPNSPPKTELMNPLPPSPPQKVGTPSRARVQDQISSPCQVRESTSPARVITNINRISTPLLMDLVHAPVATTAGKEQNPNSRQPRLSALMQSSPRPSPSKHLLEQSEKHVLVEVEGSVSPTPGQQLLVEQGLSSHPKPAMAQASVQSAHWQSKPATDTRGLSIRDSRSAPGEEEKKESYTSALRLSIEDPGRSEGPEKPGPSKFNVTEKAGNLGTVGRQPHEHETVDLTDN